VQEINGRHRLQQRFGGDAIRDLAAGQMKGDRAAVQINKSVDLGRSSAAWPAYGLGALPPFPPEALRWAFTAVLSINNSAGGPPAEANVWNTFCHTPLFDHRTNRL
jgi:hypothetical protein